MLEAGVAHGDPLLVLGGKTVKPILCRVGSMYWTNSSRPALAFWRSVQAGSLVPFENWHIEPVRSRTSMMSSGFDEQGMQAVAFALIVKWSIPSTLAKIVGTIVVCSTTTAFTGLQGAIERHFVVTVVETDGSLLLSFFAKSRPL